MAGETNEFGLQSQGSKNPKFPTATSGRENWLTSHKEKEFFPQRPESHPMIYAYSDSNPQYKGLLKVGLGCNTTNDPL